MSDNIEAEGFTTNFSTTAVCPICGETCRIVVGSHLERHLIKVGGVEKWCNASGWSIYGQRYKLAKQQSGAKP